VITRRRFMTVVAGLIAAPLAAEAQPAAKVARLGWLAPDQEVVALLLTACVVAPGPVVI
jgi:hypothetical protein